MALSAPQGRRVPSSFPPSITRCHEPVSLSPCRFNRSVIVPCGVSVVSTIKSSPPMVADELRRQADDFIELSELAPLIARNPSERAARPAVSSNPNTDSLDDGSHDQLMRTA